MTSRAYCTSETKSAAAAGTFFEGGVTPEVVFWELQESIGATVRSAPPPAGAAV